MQQQMSKLGGANFGQQTGGGGLSQDQLTTLMNDNAKLREMVEKLLAQLQQGDNTIHG